MPGRAVILSIVMVAFTSFVRAACPSDPPSWCDPLDLGPDRIPATGDERPGCTAHAGDGIHASCSQHESDRWLFEHDQACMNCPYVFYVAADCGAPIHFPFDEMRGMLFQASDVATGDLVPLEATNEAYVRWVAGAPFQYCDGCSLASAIYAKDDDIGPPINKAPGTCTANTPIGPITLTPIQALLLHEVGTTIGWGSPLNQSSPDVDGNGVMDLSEMALPPCSECAIPPCTCGTNTTNDRLSTSQIFDIVLTPPATGGVYRIDFTPSRDGEWALVANHDGSLNAELPIYDSCAAATAAWNPLPELSLGSFAVTDVSGCPATATYAVTTCNSGGSASSAPFSLLFDPGTAPDFEGDNANHPSDPACQVPLQPGECRTCSWTVPVGGSASVTAQSDRHGVVAECSETPSCHACPTGGIRTMTIDACVRHFRATMTMSRAPSGLAVTWSSEAPVARVELHAGTLASLHAGAYDHADVLSCDLGGESGTTTVADASASSGRYYVLAAVTASGTRDFGVDSRDGSVPALPEVSPCR